MISIIRSVRETVSERGVTEEDVASEIAAYRAEKNAQP
jgi:hypothetical protein